MRTFEFSEGTSNKFWRIEVSGNRTTVTYGKIGTAGQTQVKDHADAAAAQKEHDKLVAEKLKKGYKETTPAGAAAPAPAAPAAPAKTAKPAKAKESAPAPAAPPAEPPKKEAPAAAAIAGSERTFEYSDATSHKFWNVQLKGSALTITYGRIGATGQTQLKSFPDEAAARKEQDKLIAEKVKKGYRETTPSAKKEPTSLRESLEAALVESPDELANHMAYADYLGEQGDPLGEFIRVQLALEDPARSPNDRKKLQAQEQKLLDAHARTWLGELAPYAFGEVPRTNDYEEPVKLQYAFRRGWLDTIKADYADLAFTRILARATQVRLLRHLEFPHTAYADDGTPPEPSDGVPEGCYHPALYPLGRSDNLTNVRTFIVGEVMSEQEDDGYLDYGPSCHTGADGAIGPVKRMPRLEELRLLAHRTDTAQLFALKTLHNLRILHVDHCHKFALAQLAKNPSLGNLTHLLIWPHALESGDEPYIRLADVKAVVNSPTLKSLTHLRLRCSDAGDKGVREIVASGVLKRLKVLDLRHGCVSDAGARALAACADLKNLQLLDLCNNAMTNEGVGALTATGVKLKAQNQWDLSTAHAEEPMYLWCGDVE
jgi:uncharacterized protein (TIGR02996 family)